jgi:hypothetical protein
MIPPSPHPIKADQPKRPDVTYLPRHCPFLKQDVRAIVTKQADGTWRIVNCLDKHEPCFEHHCAFTVDGGEWPFGDVAVDKPQFTDQP